MATATKKEGTKTQAKASPNPASAPSKKKEKKPAEAEVNQPSLERREVTCSCGAKHIFYSAQALSRLEICSQCHPFYTGSQRLVDSAGRVDKFKKKYKMK